VSHHNGVSQQQVRSYNITFTQLRSNRIYL